MYIYTYYIYIYIYIYDRGVWSEGGYDLNPSPEMDYEVGGDVMGGVIMGGVCVLCTIQETAIFAWW